LGFAGILWGFANTYIFSIYTYKPFKKCLMTFSKAGGYQNFGTLKVTAHKK
jgi:hypothetical protein